mgnify:FL=1
MEAKIISDKGLTVATGTSYATKNILDKFLDNTEKQAIHNAINNLK